MPYWMVHIAPLHKPCVVMSGGSIDNIGIHIVMGRKLLSLVYDGLHMVAAVRLVKMVITGNDLPLHVADKSRIYLVNCAHFPSPKI